MQLRGRWSKLNGRKERKGKIKWRRGTKEARVIDETDATNSLAIKYTNRREDDENRAGRIVGGTIKEVEKDVHVYVGLDEGREGSTKERKRKNGEVETPLLRRIGVIARKRKWKREQR
ncbi:hypothetical protein QLX08_009135 [Tetragonisca angustula]|uniref:Uncharacterized protein n=1 Tax=Tetragonisca angustula TaxID=166442 RepID=A0AAW0ZHJ8_9HYME